MFRPYIKRTSVLLSIAVFNVVLVYIAHTYSPFIPDKHYKLKIHASEIMRKALDATNAYFKKKIKDPSVTQLDIFNSGLIGVEDSRITTKSGIFESKLSTTNPDFAALYINYFSQIDDALGTSLTNTDVQDTIAVGLTGSFPGANIALLSACKASNIYPVIISSIGSSSWGANRSEMTWIDIEKILHGEIFSYKSIAVSLGGDNDVAEELMDNVKRGLEQKIKDYSYEFIYEIPLSKSIEAKMNIYNSFSKNYKVYINIGGSASNLGNEVLSQFFKPGLNFNKDPDLIIDEEISISYDIHLKPIMYKFEANNIPIINIRNINKLCIENDLPYWEVDRYGAYSSRLFGVYPEYPLSIIWPCFIASFLVLLWVVFSSIKQVNQKMEEIENDTII